MASVIDLYDQRALLEDGNLHKISWQRTSGGLMSVELDGHQIIRRRDKSYRAAFDGFVMSNYGGDYAIRSVSIHHMNR